MSGVVVHLDTAGLLQVARLLGEAVRGAARVPAHVVRRH